MNLNGYVVVQEWQTKYASAEKGFIDNIQLNIKRHEYRKAKECPINQNGLMNEIEDDHRITVESDAVNKRIEKLRAAQKDLRQAMKHWKKLQ